MISKAVHGSDTIGALRYLFGPGKANEHTDPHIVASWDSFAPDPGRVPWGERTAALAQLRDALDLHVVQYGRKINKHVYHRPVRADGSDRILTDEEWGTIARRIVAAAGIAPDGDEDGCRWIAVRHADDHIHILTTTVRADLKQARLRGDQYRVEAELTKIETEYGLVDLSETRTPEYRAVIPKRAKGAELRKAERLGREQSDRDALRTAVRKALAGAASEEEFAARLSAQDIRFGVRRAPSGDVTGYKFALPTVEGDSSVWFSGSKLAPDLTQPQIRARFSLGTDQPAYPTPDRSAWPAASRDQASSTVDRTYPVIDSVQDVDRAEEVIRGGIEILDALAVTSPTLSRKEIHQAARALDYTRIAHTRAVGADLRAMRSAARSLLHAGPTTGRVEDGTAAATVLSSVVLLAVLIAKWHAAQGHQRQAAAARTAADHLRTAYARHATKPLAHLDLEGRLMPKPPAAGRRRPSVRHCPPATPPRYWLRVTGQPSPPPSPKPKPQATTPPPCSPRPQAAENSPPPTHPPQSSPGASAATPPCPPRPHPTSAAPVPHSPRAPPPAHPPPRPRLRQNPPPHQRRHTPGPLRLGADPAAEAAQRTPPTVLLGLCMSHACHPSTCCSTRITRSVPKPTPAPTVKVDAPHQRCASRAGGVTHAFGAAAIEPPTPPSLTRADGHRR